jgi:hypothetical protein
VLFEDSDNGALLRRWRDYRGRKAGEEAFLLLCCFKAGIGIEYNSAAASPVCLHLTY